jgi:uncharacterized iron-regulated membrane protein
MSYWRRPQNVWLRRALFQVHLWTGVTAALYVFLVCASGAALVFRIDMQRALYPQLLRAATPDSLADASLVLTNVQAAYPDFRLSGVEAPTTLRATYLSYVSAHGRYHAVLSDPASGRVLGMLPEHSPVSWLQDLHFNLFAGHTGRLVNAAGAGCLLLMCLTGPVIWWSGSASWRQALTVDLRHPWRVAVRELHSVIGIAAVCSLLVWSLSGLYFLFPAAFRGAVNAVSPVHGLQSPRSSRPQAQAAPLAWRDLIETARHGAPARHLARVVLPTSPDAAFRVDFSALRPTPAGGAELVTVYLDQYTGLPLSAPAPSATSAGDLIMAWAAPLHVGNFAGDGVRWLWLLLGLCAPTLAVTGLIMWWTRVVARRARPGA